MYKCKFFSIRELVHPSFLGTSEDILWRLFDDRLLKYADKIREKYGYSSINRGITLANTFLCDNLNFDHDEDLM